MPLNRLQQATHPQQKNGASNNSSYAGAWEGIYDPWDYDPNQGWTGEPGWTPGSGTGTGPNPPPPGPDPTPDPGEGVYDSDETIPGWVPGGGGTAGGGTGGGGTGGDNPNPGAWGRPSNPEMHYLTGKYKGVNPMYQGNIDFTEQSELLNSVDRQSIWEQFLNNPLPQDISVFGSAPTPPHPKYNAEGDGYTPEYERYMEERDTWETNINNSWQTILADSQDFPYVSDDEKVYLENPLATIQAFNSGFGALPGVTMDMASEQRRMQNTNQSRFMNSLGNTGLFGGGNNIRKQMGQNKTAMDIGMNNVQSFHDSHAAGLAGLINNMNTRWDENVSEIIGGR